VKFFLPATCSGNYFNFFGIVDIHPQLQKWLLKQRKLFLEWHEKHDELYQVVLLEGSVDWYEVDDARLSYADRVRLRSERADPECEHDGPVKLPDDFTKLESLLAQTAGDMVSISTGGVRWKCFPEHTDQSLTSYVLLWDELCDSKSQLKRIETQLHGRRRGKK
jgi:hypothetical protein